MKKTILTLLSLCIFAWGYSQVDTISNNIFQKDGRLGIGTNDPQIRFHIKDSTGQLYLGYQPAYDGPFINMIGKIAGQTPMFGLGIAIKDYNYHGDTLCYKDWAYLYGNVYNKGIAIVPDLVRTPDGLFVDKYGSVGIGVEKPEAKLQVADGDIYISDAEKGIIMKSPDGNCWRGILDNSGQLDFSMIDCPEIDTGITGIQQFIETENIIVYPNPSNTLINIEQPGKKINKQTYKICNLSGQIQTIGKIKTNNESIDISNLSDGVFILTLYDKNGEKLTSQKIIKK
jgi:hypothetical protein